MNYAIVENGTVINTISLLPDNAGEFAKAVPMDDIPTAIGDSYAEGIFYRIGEPIKSLAEIIVENVDYKALYEAVLADMNDLMSLLSNVTSSLPDTAMNILQEYEEETA